MIIIIIITIIVIIIIIIIILYLRLHPQQGRGGHGPVEDLDLSPLALDLAGLLLSLGGGGVVLDPLVDEWLDLQLAGPEPVVAQVALRATSGGGAVGLGARDVGEHVAMRHVVLQQLFVEAGLSVVLLLEDVLLRIHLR